MRIVAIGGGEIGTVDDVYNLQEIDEEIVKMTGKTHPIMVFIGFNERANYFFGRLKKNYMALGAQCIYIKHTELWKEKTVEGKIKRADIIFLNGGNTMEFMKQIKKNKLDIFLKKALDRNAIMCGISAGAICYHKFGSSDSRTYKTSEKKFTKVTGMGFVDALFAPHYSNSDRPLDMERMMKNVKQVAICADNCTALVIDEENYKVLKTDKNANIYKCYNDKSGFKIYKIEEYGVVKDLLSKN